MGKNPLIAVTSSQTWFVSKLLQIKLIVFILQGSVCVQEITFVQYSGFPDL